MIVWQSTFNNVLWKTADILQLAGLFVSGMNQINQMEEFLKNVCKKRLKTT
jgi:hypothetical protein